MRRSIPLVLAAAALLVASPGAQATFPGDNGLIVFQDMTDHGVQLFTMTASGEDIRQITDFVPAPGDTDGAVQADWSPDGSRLAFAYLGCQIGLIDPDGGNLALLSDPAETGRPGIDLCEADPSFTPDGRSLVFERFDGTTDAIWRMAVDGTERSLVTDACGIDPNVSPDGSQLSCKGTGLVLLDLDGSGPPKELTPGLDIGYRHDWAPDGSALVFADHKGPSASGVNLLSIPPDGTDQHPLTDNTEPDQGTGFGGYSPDGSSIIYRQDRGQDEHAVFIMAPDGRDVRQVTDFSDFGPSGMDWGPAPAD